MELKELAEMLEYRIETLKKLKNKEKQNTYRTGLINGEILNTREILQILFEDAIGKNPYEKYIEEMERIKG